MPEKADNKMKPCYLEKQLGNYGNFLRKEERSINSITKYIRYLRAFFCYAAEREVDKVAVLLWKEHLTETYAPASVNSMLAAVNGFLEWLGLPRYKVKPLKIQRAIFAKPEKELTEAEYRRLVEAAELNGNRRLALLLQTICATGIRVSELRFITVTAMPTGRAVVDCKGKTRIVFLPAELCRILRRYCQEQAITSGVIFRTKSGRAINRSNIWKMMKELCESAGVEPGKVFPHNLRHNYSLIWMSFGRFQVGIGVD